MSKSSCHSKYQAVLFDLFDTLVDFKVERFPLIKIGEKERRSTGGIVYQALQEFYNQISLEEFFDAFVPTSLELDQLRNQDHREILSHDRFRRVLTRLGIDSPSPEVVERLVTAHMDAMVAVMEFPPSRRRVLEVLKPRHRLGIVSNFDHPPTAHRVLDHFNLLPFFDVVVISGDAGWRKPHREIFRQALTALAISPRDVLFVGDTLYADIVGAKGVGMDVVWLDHQVIKLDPKLPQPDYLISDLEELPSILALA